MARVLGFQAGVDEGAAEDVRDWEFGTAVLSPSIPQVWDANYFRLADGADAPARDIAAAAARVATDAGLAHAAIVAPEQQADALEPDLQRLGFERTQFQILALRRRPASPGHQVVEVVAQDVAASRAEGTLEFFPGNHALVAQLAELDRRLARTIGGRWFAIRESGEVASRAWLLRRNGIGQVEDVATAPAKRGLGYARAVVSAAARASLEAGDDLVFIVADAEDSVTRLYRSIGFEPLGTTSRFVRPLGA